MTLSLGFDSITWLLDSKGPSRYLCLSRPVVTSIAELIKDPQTRPPKFARNPIPIRFEYLQVTSEYLF